MMRTAAYTLPPHPTRTVMFAFDKISLRWLFISFYIPITMCCCRPPGFAVPLSLCHHKQLLNYSAAESHAASVLFLFSPSLHPSPSGFFFSFASFILVGIEFQKLPDEQEKSINYLEQGLVWVILICVMLATLAEVWLPLHLFCSINPCLISS